ncbi:MAG: sugar ABC transporter [Deltaproteobacteria bacterium]|nr:sugar ABC transporter [Deltaproteobacteria bacterium]
MKKLVVLAVFCLLSACVDDGKKTILVIESYHAEYLWDAGYVRGLKSKLGEAFNLEFFYMDTKRLPKEEHQAMAAKALDTYHAVKPDLVIIGDDAALKFTGPRLARTSTPVVFLGINNNPRNYFMQWPRNFTGILERPLLAESIATMKAVMPDLRRVAVLFDTDLTARATHEELFVNQDETTIAGVEVDIKMVPTFAEWQRLVAESGQNYQAYVMGLYHNLKDESGATVDPEQVAVWTSANSPVPLFAFWDFSVSADKAVGGLIVSAEEQGRMAADVAERILSGAKPEEIPPASGGNGELLFSQTQLAKHGLTLPRDMLARLLD